MLDLFSELVDMILELLRLSLVFNHISIHIQSFLNCHSVPEFLSLVVQCGVIQSVHLHTQYFRHLLYPLSLLGCHWLGVLTLLEIVDVTFVLFLPRLIDLFEVNNSHKNGCERVNHSFLVLGLAVSSLESYDLLDSSLEDVRNRVRTPFLIILVVLHYSGHSFVKFHHILHVCVWHLLIWRVWLLYLVLRRRRVGHD